MNTWRIKGRCEHCGFAYKGSVGSEKNYLPPIKCPACHQISANFDEENGLLGFGRYDDSSLEHTESQLETIREK